MNKNKKDRIFNKKSFIKINQTFYNNWYFQFKNLLFYK